MTKYKMYTIEELFPSEDGDDERFQIWTTDDREHAERIKRAILSVVQSVVIDVREIDVDTSKWLEVPNDEGDDGYS